MSFAKVLTNYLEAMYPALWVETHEDQRCCIDIQRTATEMGMRVYRWRMTTGWSVLSGSGEQAQSDVYGAREALESVIRMPEDSVFIFINFHFFLDMPDVLQTIKDLIPLVKTTGRHLIFVSPRANLPPEIEKEIVLIEYALPTREELACVLRDVASSPELPITVDEKAEEKLVEAALGMTVQEAENAFSLAVVRHRALNKDAVETVMQEKVNIVRKSKLLEFYPAEEGGFDAVGGLQNLKEWLAVRRCAFSGEARRLGIAAPKGILLAGVPGTGKTLTARAVAKAWGWPLLRFDVGRVYGSLVGESESRMRQVLRLAETVAPVVMLIDEAEKGLAGFQSSGSTDSGVTARVMGDLLTWMNDKTAPVFVVATVNRIEMLPPELLRKGRFNEIFFVDLPDEEERREIFSIHLRKRNIDCWDDTLVTATKDFSGAEIREVVEEAQLMAFAEGRRVTVGDLSKAIGATVPLASTMREEINRLREWAKNRARLANLRREERLQGTRRLRA
ncbi:MAG: AAA family ATPase [Bacillota bacterium]